MEVKDYAFEITEDYAETRCIKTMYLKMLKLVEKNYPTMKGKVIVDGEQYGGVKLVYQKPIGFSLINKTSEKIVFLKPFKKYWADSKKDCTPGEWGNTNSPLTTVWLKLTVNQDYKDFREVYQYVRSEKVIDAKIIAALNKEQDIQLDQPKEIPSVEVIKFTSEEIISKIKSKITKLWLRLN